MTVVTGGIDRLTGGGMTAPRGTRHESLRAAGAAGAGHCRRRRAGFQPVGWGSPRRVVAYSAWSGGNYIYDHWGAITDLHREGSELGGRSRELDRAGSTPEESDAAYYKKLQMLNVGVM